MSFQAAIDILRGKKKLVFKPSMKILRNEQPLIYNRLGMPLETVYLKDTYLGPYAWQGDYVFFDRYNYALKKHLYTHSEMLHTEKTAVRKFAALIEAEAILPEDYKIFDKHKGLEKEFEKIFTHSDRLLDKLSNAVFFPAGGAWVENDDDLLYEKKSELVSMICSKKNDTKFHQLRIKIARNLRDNALADVFGNLDGGSRFDKKETTLAPYRFQVVVENSIEPYYFTEKVLDCFLEFTIPVYIGASKIGEFFNKDGIIEVKPEDYDKIDTIIKKLTPEFYKDHLEAVKENYYKALEYNDFNKYIYEKMK